MLNPCPFPSTTSSKELVDARWTLASERACTAFFFFWRNVKVVQRRLFPVNLFDIGDSQLRCIVSAEGNSKPSRGPGNSCGGIRVSLFDPKSASYAAYNVLYSGETVYLSVIWVICGPPPFTLIMNSRIKSMLQDRRVIKCNPSRIRTFKCA